MDTAITTIYCLTDDFLKAQHHRQNPQCTLSDAEIVTIALTAARFFGGNFETAMTFLTEQRYLARRLSRGQFNQRLHRLTEVFQGLFECLAQVWKNTADALHFSLDSFPVSVCDNIRIKRSRLYPIEATDDAFRGYTPSKRRYFYGLKVHLMVNSAGFPVEVFFTAGGASDVEQLRNFAFDLPAGATVYADKAYNEYFSEDLLAVASQIDLSPLRKKNSRRAVPAYVAYVQHHFRKRVETTISLFERLLPKSIHAVTARGFELKVFLFVLACSFEGLY